MKKNRLFALLFALFIFSCKEEPIIIPPLGNNNPTTDEVVRKVFVEEYTGAGCVNCPDGAAILNDLQKNVYKDKVILVAIHAGFFTKKNQLPKEALLDLTTPKGTELQLYLGEPNGYPAAIVNRKIRDNSNGSLVADSKDQWASIIQADAKEKGTAKIIFKNGYDDANRNLQLNFTIEPTADLVGDYAYTIMVTEDNIVDAQKTPNGVKTDYTHRHVLRDILTPAQGVAITEKLKKGAVISRSMNFKLPTSWKSKDCEVIVLLHKTGTSKEVIQVEESKIQN